MPKTVTTWKEGQSGNPKGRPKDVRTLVTLKNDLEVAVRQHLSPTRVTQVVNRMLEIATNPATKDKDAISAGKVILDMAIIKGATQQEFDGKQALKIVIETLTLQQVPVMAKVVSEPIEAEYTKVNENGEVSSNPS